MSLKLINFAKPFSTQAKQSFFVTTPIYYVNAAPHIGHLYSSVITDAIQRWQQMCKKTVKFSTGTDEHGIKIQQAAAKHNSKPDEYCNKISSKYKELADTFSIQYTDFVRTSSEAHKNTVHEFWKVLDKKGCIQSTNYEGWYCVSDESFLSKSQLKEIEVNGKKVLVSAESGHPVEWTEERNYVFKLGLFQKDLQYWINSNENIVKPKTFQKILSQWITEMELPDVSVSRPTSRVHWGIHVPNDETQTVYVWLDALVNYLTVAGYSQSNFHKIWPPDVQVIGKDILKFHGIYWPAFLMAANLEPPRTLLCHSHWTVDNEKMSKSKNNVICPMERSEIYSRDGLRYFLLREGVAHSDGNYSDTKVIRILNSELADTLGNLLNRCCGMILNPEQKFPQIDMTTFNKLRETSDVTKKLIENIKSLPDICEQHYNDYNFYKVVDSIIATLHSANLFFETLKPWQLRKQPENFQELEVVLHLALECLRVCTILLQPIIPNLASNLLNKLKIPEKERFYDNSRKVSWENPQFFSYKLSDEKFVLFQRIITSDDSKKKKQVKIS